jgi:hypothetical protein
VASAFLLFPPKAVEKEVILMCSRVKHKECEVKPRDGELFVSRILSIEPEGVTFKKPVTVLLSHSVYEDQVFEDFYELIVEHLSQNRWHDLKTERIGSVEGTQINYNIVLYTYYLNTSIAVRLEILCLKKDVLYTSILNGVKNDPSNEFIGEVILKINVLYKPRKSKLNLI